MKSQATAKYSSSASAAVVAHIDHETRLIEADHHSVKLWLRLLTCSSLVEGHLRTALREEFGTTLPRFDFLAQLERSPDGLTMGQLTKRMMVSGGNISCIATQLVEEGMINRTAYPADRRTFVVKLTSKGRKLFQKMAARHEEWVIQLLGDLTTGDAEKLYGLLGKVKGTLTANSTSLHESSAG